MIVDILNVFPKRNPKNRGRDTEKNNPKNILDIDIERVVFPIIQSIDDVKITHIKNKRNKKIYLFRKNCFKRFKNKVELVKKYIKNETNINIVEININFIPTGITNVCKQMRDEKVII